MSESPKEKNQVFSDYISLVKKIEKIVEETPDIIKGDELKVEQPTESGSESQPDSITQKEEIVEVEQQTSKLEERISEVAAKADGSISQKKIEDLIRTEKELIEFYSNAKIQLSDFYFKEKEKQENEIINGIKTKLQSLEKISVKKRETYGIPFALCKLEGKYQAIIPVEIDKIKLPTLMVGANKNFKLLLVSNDEILNLTPNEQNLWNQAFNRFQIKLTQILSSRAKENLTKVSPKMKLFKIDSSKIHHYIKEYETRLQGLQNYQQEILKHLQEINNLIINENSFWKNDDEFQKAKQELKNQLIEFEEKQKKISRESQVDFIKLKRIQKRLDARTKKYKLDEKRNKKIPREEKEKLIKEVREFQSKKLHIHENIEHTKRMEETLRKWVEIFSQTDINQANEMMLENYYQGLVEKIQTFTETQDIDSILEGSILVSSDISEIILHVIYIPTTLYTYKAKQGGQDIEGKAIFLAPTQEIILLNPSVV